MLPNKSLHSNRHLRKSDALAKDRLTKVVKLCLQFEETAAHNSGQKALVFEDKVQINFNNAENIDTGIISIFDISISDFSELASVDWKYLNNSKIYQIQHLLLVDRLHQKLN